MRPSILVSIAAVGAVMLCIITSYGTASIFNGLNPDPYEHSFEYQIEGKYGEEDCTGTGRIYTIHESGAYHNYEASFDIVLGADTLRSGFTVIFNDNGEPEYFSKTGEETFGNDVCSIYSGTTDGKTISITVGENCWIRAFTYEDGSLRCSGTEKEAEI